MNSLNYARCAPIPIYFVARLVYSVKFLRRRAPTEEFILGRFQLASLGKNRRGPSKPSSTFTGIELVLRFALHFENLISYLSSNDSDHSGSHCGKYPFCGHVT